MPIEPESGRSAGRSSTQGWSTLVTEGPGPHAEAHHDYLEVVEITELDDYRASLDPSSSPEVKDFFEQWSSFVAESLVVYGEVIE